MCECKQKTCRECHARLAGQARRRRFWTPALLRMLREAYQAPNKAALSAALESMSAQVRLPRQTLIDQARVMGIGAPRVAWSAEDLAYLAEAMGELSTAAIASHLHRSWGAVASKAESLRFSRKTRDGYTSSDLSDVMGVSRETVAHWMRRGLFGRVREANGHRVTDENVVAFLKGHSREYDLRRVDQEWFKSMAVAAFAAAAD